MVCPSTLSHRGSSFIFESKVTIQTLPFLWGQPWMGTRWQAERASQMWLNMATSEHYKGTINCTLVRDTGGRSIVPSAVAAEPHPITLAAPARMPHVFMFLKKHSPTKMD